MFGLSYPWKQHGLSTAVMLLIAKVWQNKGTKHFFVKKKKYYLNSHYWDVSLTWHLSLG